MKGKGTGPRRGASQYKTLHATQGELMSRFLKHSTWYILFNIRGSYPNRSSEVQILSVPKKNETVHSPPFSLKTVVIERFALLAAILVSYLPWGWASRFIVPRPLSTFDTDVPRVLSYSVRGQWERG